MLLKKLKIIKKVKFIRSRSSRRMCNGFCRLFDGIKYCDKIYINKYTVGDLCADANTELNDDYIPLDYAINKTYN